MLHKVIHTSLLLLILSFEISAQVQRDYALQQRSQWVEPYIVDSARRYGIDPRILRALCYLESRFRLDAISPKGARGPMQFMPETVERYGLTNPHDPKTSIDAAARYIRDLLRRFDGRIDLAFAAYNAGEGTVEAFQKGYTLRSANGRVINAARIITSGIPPYRETQNYVSSAIRLLTEAGVVVPRQSGVSLTNAKLTSTRDFTIDVFLNPNGSTSHLTTRPTPFFIEVP